MAIEYAKLKEKVRQELEYRLGRKPTEEEVTLEADIQLIDSSGGHTIDYRHGKHKKQS